MKRFTVLLTVAICACGSPPRVHEFDRSITIAASYEEVWEAVIEMFASRNTPIATLERESGIITTEVMSTTADQGFADCGGSGLNTFRNMTGRYNLFVREAVDGIAVQMNTNWNTQVWLGNNYNGSRECTSTGRFETAFLSQLVLRSGGTLVRGLNQARGDVVANSTATANPAAPADTPTTERQRRAAEQYGVESRGEHLPEFTASVRTYAGGEAAEAVRAVQRAMAAASFETNATRRDHDCYAGLDGTRDDDAVTVLVCAVEDPASPELAWEIRVLGFRLSLINDVRRTLDAELSRS